MFTILGNIGFQTLSSLEIKFYLKFYTIGRFVNENVGYFKHILCEVNSSSGYLVSHK